jgi:hypothetical protein
VVPRPGDALNASIDDGKGDPHEDEHELSAQRIIEVLKIFFTFLAAWLQYRMFETLSDILKTSINRPDAMLMDMFEATFMTASSSTAIWLLQFSILAPQWLVPNQTLRFYTDMFGVVIGFAWEKVVRLACQSIGDELSRASVTFAMCCTFILTVYPAYVWHIAPIQVRLSKAG